MRGRLPNLMHGKAERGGKILLRLAELRANRTHLKLWRHEELSGLLLAARNRDGPPATPVTPHR